MAFNNPNITWRELERRLSDKGGMLGAFPGDGGDSPAWSTKREKYESPRDLITKASSTAYAELHCHSNFSFLDGASSPEQLVEEAVRLDLRALAVTDHDGFYGVVRFAEAARAVGLPTVFGTELSVDATGNRTGTPDPSGQRLVLLARNPKGYASLATTISRSQLAGNKGEPKISLNHLENVANGNWLVLTGGRRGAVTSALMSEGPAAGERALRELAALFGRDNVAVELTEHGDPLDAARNDHLAELAARVGVHLIATNNVHYATPRQRRLATALAAVRARRSLDDMQGWMAPGAAAHLRSGDEQARWFARFPGVVTTAAELAMDCAFDLALVAPKLPDFPVPTGHSELTWLRELVRQGALRRYGTPAAERVDGAYAQLEHELKLIGEMGFEGYFLVVFDIVDFCRRSNIFCQGRGSAANSAVCYALGITNVDAVALGLLFERFLSPERDGPPDIDIDIESGRREEVIQYVYGRYGREHAAQVANVISYRPRSAIRDMARALGYAAGQQDVWAKHLDRWGSLSDYSTQANNGADNDGHPVPHPDAPPLEVLELAAEVEHFPRLLGIHSGGMVICDRPVIEVCPVEWASMANRSVLQWDKDDCAVVGLVKFDLLGLGMLSALHGAVDLIAEHHHVSVDLATIAQEDAVYDMLCKADTIGVFQVESRAQMATLPRLKPRCFYDLVVEIALIRPGPIQGGSVHPYIRRRNGEEPVTYLHPLLEPSLKKTLGIPLFQEQLMQMAIDVAGFSANEADELRQAMGSKRSKLRMQQLKQRLFDGMSERGVTEEAAEQIYLKMAAFANYGFPESHSVSFAYLVYSSSWIKLHYPAAFCAALLNAQPMGFYSPHSLVQDARRHGVTVLTPDLAASDTETCLIADITDAGPAVRLGMMTVRGIGKDLAAEIASGRPYCDIEDLVRRTELSLVQLEAMATAGVFGCFGMDRREALWAVGAVSQSRAGRLNGIVTGEVAPQLPGMSERETAAADLWSTGVSPYGHPTRFLREHLSLAGVVTASDLLGLPDGT
ncbi:MAG: error-prone DNA polymerase, partial [Acidimicrobiales bacterium]